MAEHTLKTMRCENQEIFKVWLAIFQYAFNDYIYLLRKKKNQRMFALAYTNL